MFHVSAEIQKRLDDVIRILGCFAVLLTLSVSFSCLSLYFLQQTLSIRLFGHVGDTRCRAIQHGNIRNYVEVK